MKPFENQVAIVTGAGRGIGEAIAKRFAEQGAKLAVVSRTDRNSQKTADAINALSPDAAKPYSVDVADYDAVQKIGEKILADFGRCDVLVNNAGVTRDTLIMRMGSEDWDVVLDTNLKGAFNFIRAVLRPMVKQRKGRIINISSVSGLMGLAGQANYAASKAGLVGLYQDGGARAREPEYHRERRGAGICRNGYDLRANRRRPEGRAHANPAHAFWRRRRHCRRGYLSRQSRGLLHHRAGPCRGRRDEHVAPELARDMHGYFNGFPACRKPRFRVGRWSGAR